MVFDEVRPLRIMEGPQGECSAIHQELNISQLFNGDAVSSATQVTVQQHVTSPNVKLMGKQENPDRCILYKHDWCAMAKGFDLVVPPLKFIACHSGRCRQV